MNAIRIEIQLWFCDICDKTINFSSRLKPIKTETHTHKKEYGTVVNVIEYKPIRPEID